MKKLGINTLLLFVFGGLLAQSPSIKGTIRNFPGGTISLGAYLGDDLEKIDSCKVSPGGDFEFVAKHLLVPGLYQLDMGEKKTLGLIIDKNTDSLNILLNYNDINGDLVITGSQENVVYQGYLSRKEDFINKNQLLVPVVNYYSPKSRFYKKAVREYEKNIKQQVKYEQDIIDKHPNSLLASIVRMNKTLFIPASLSQVEKHTYLKNHFFDGADFSDTALLRTPAIAEKIINYLSLYSNNQYTREQQEDAFVEAVDVILHKTLANNQVYEYIVDYLVDGFHQFGLHKVVDFIAENNALEKSCIKDKNHEELSERLKNIEKVALGKVAPGFSFTDMRGKEITLSKIDASYTLVVFWASWCPHCKVVLDELKQYYDFTSKNEGDNIPDLEIIAVSLDNDMAEYKKTLEERQYNWINYSELKGWDSKIALDYNVDATPTLFLLDKNKKIIAKPSSLIDLERELTPRQ